MGSKRKRSRKYDRIRDEKMKGHTKRNQNQPTEISEEDEIHEEDKSNEEEEIGSSNNRNKLKGIANLMDLDEEPLFNQIPSKHMITLLECIVKTCGMNISKIKVYLERHSYLSSYLGEEI